MIQRVIELEQETHKSALPFFGRDDIWAKALLAMTYLEQVQPRLCVAVQKLHYIFS